jgi:NADH-quinone oxidoreductase subunit A
MASPLAIVGYLALFAGAAVGFLFVNLLVGRLVRPKIHNAEKLEVYECGEPTIGSSFVQFDLRFYVVALLFIIFDVEVAFFFPWATVFGKSAQLASMDMPVATAEGDALSPQAAERFRELGVSNPELPTLSAERARELGVEDNPRAMARAAVSDVSRKLALASLCDIAVFFGVLMVGFAYVWKRGDLDWVRSVRSHEGEVVERPPLALEGEAARARTAGSILSA